MPQAASRIERLAGTPAALAWLRARGAARLVCDSRQLRAGDAFIAWPGHAFDARQFVGQALAGGAAACLVEAQGVEPFGFRDARVAAVAGLKAATGPLASAWVGEPSGALDVIAVTGTNGKTSTATWTAQALAALGRRCGLVGTLGVGEPGVAGYAIEADTLRATGLTTPDPITLHQAFRDFADAGCQACAIEASSIGLDEGRLAGTRIAVAQFTNLTQDHLDYHGSMDAYRVSKARLFDWPGLRAAVIDIDDAFGADQAARLRARPMDLWTVSAHDENARLHAADLHHREGGGLAFTLVEGGQRSEVAGRLVGAFNLSNLLVVAGALRALGVPLADIGPVLSRLEPVPGRMQRVPAAGAAMPLVVVDYAHTPDALDKALQALRPLAAARGGRLWCVFGCGGNRDAGKRPLMGAIAERQADQVVLTSDNPRDEAPGFILSQILAGVTGHDDVDVIEERGEAIDDVVRRAAPADVVLLAGKGHEDYQETAGVRRPFSDLDHAAAALARRAGSTEMPR